METRESESESVEFDPSEIEYVSYGGEHHLPLIMRLVDEELSEPYSIFTYRYFVYLWPNLSFLAFHKGNCIGTVVCKMGEHRNTFRGYIAMLVVIKPYRGKGIATELVTRSIRVMMESGCEEIAAVAKEDGKNIPRVCSQYNRWDPICYRRNSASVLQASKLNEVGLEGPLAIQMLVFGMVIADQCSFGNTSTVFSEVTLEAEVTNKGALALYGRLGFIRAKRLFRYYLNGVDAFRLKLLFPRPEMNPSLLAVSDREGSHIYSHLQAPGHIYDHLQLPDGSSHPQSI